MRIGPAVYKGRWLVLIAWLGIAAGLCVIAPALNPTAHEPTSFLPADNPYSRAADALRHAFPHSSGLSQAVVVFERSDAKFTPDDFRAIEKIAADIAKPIPPKMTASDLEGVSIRSPGAFSFAGVSLPANPLKSPDGRAALILVDVPANFITIRSSRVVDHVRNLLAAAHLPAGLHAAVTGSSGFGHDYAAATEASHESIGLVTVISVLVILLLVYRSPIAAFVPLIAISVAAVVAMRVLAVGQHFGIHVGTGEKVFVFVLIYGAGMDYSMLFISRFRETLHAGMAKGPGTGAALGATLAAILASAGTDTLGLLMLSAAQYQIFRTAGLAIAIALIVALLASVTLVPALAGLLGKALFWPGRRFGQLGETRFWPAVGRTATRRPVWIMIAVVGLLAIPAVRGGHLTWVYDTLAEIEPLSPNGVGNAAVGLNAVKKHWPVGQIAPITVLVQSKKPLPDATWQRLAERLTSAVASADGVQDVRSLTQPLGEHVDMITRLGLRAAAGKINAQYVSADRTAMRLEAVLDKPSLTLSAMADLAAIRQTVDKTLAGASAWHIFAPASAAATAPAPPAAADDHAHSLAASFTGATAEMAEMRIVTHADFRRIAVLVLAVIFTMILILLRDPILSAFIVAATCLSYFATLGLAYWLLLLAGSSGLDWKVEVFLFVVMVAVGVDYSIFLAARVSQEARNTAGNVAAAVRNAVIHTGPVISSCGLIMAATLGSLMAGQLKLFVQLGLTLSLGMLIDTFVIRPLLLPAFITLVKRTGKIPRFLE